MLCTTVDLLLLTHVTIRIDDLFSEFVSDLVFRGCAFGQGLIIGNGGLVGHSTPSMCIYANSLRSDLQDRSSSFILYYATLFTAKLDLLTIPTWD